LTFQHRRSTEPIIPNTSATEVIGQIPLTFSDWRPLQHVEDPLHKGLEQELLPNTMGWMAPAPDGAKMSPCVDGSRVGSGRYRSCSSCRVLLGWTAAARRSGWQLIGNQDEMRGRCRFFLRGARAATVWSVRTTPSGSRGRPA